MQQQLLDAWMHDCSPPSNKPVLAHPWSGVVKVAGSDAGEVMLAPPLPAFTASASTRYVVRASRPSIEQVVGSEAVGAAVHAAAVQPEAPLSLSTTQAARLKLAHWPPVLGAVTTASAESPSMAAADTTGFLRSSRGRAGVSCGGHAMHLLAQYAGRAGAALRPRIPPSQLGSLVGRGGEVDALGGGGRDGRVARQLLLSHHHHAVGGAGLQPLQRARGHR